MGQDRITTLEKDLQQIAEMLVLNGTLTECSSLVHGKIGIAIFFFQITISESHHSVEKES